MCNVVWLALHTAVDLYEQQMNFEASEVCKIAKNCFGKYVYYIGILLSLL
jgi:hypothetical protein